MKIIYKINDDGVPDYIQYSQSDRKGFESIEMNSEIRKIEDVDWEAIKTTAAKEREALQAQETKLLDLIKDNVWHVMEHGPGSGRRFALDWNTWDNKIKEWEAQLLEVKAGNLVEIAEKPEF